MDMIVDFSASLPVAIPSRLTHERVAMPSPVPGFRRIYVAPRDELFGSLRMYAIPHDDPTRPGRPQPGHGLRRARTAERLRDGLTAGSMVGRRSSPAPAA